MDVVGDVVEQLRYVHTRLAALEAGSDPSVKFEWILAPALVTFAFQAAMHLFRMELTMLRTLKAIVKDCSLQVGLEVCRIASICLGFQSVIHVLARRSRACVSGYTDCGIS